MDERTRNLVGDYYQRFWNRWDFSAGEPLLAADCRLEGAVGLDKRGLAGITEYMELLRGAFPDLHHHVDELLGEGNRVVARVTHSATHEGPLFGRAATGRKVSYAGVTFFTVQGGRIQSIWVLSDLYTLMNQICAH